MNSADWRCRLLLEETIPVGVFHLALRNIRNGKAAAEKRQLEQVVLPDGVLFLRTTHVGYQSVIRGQRETVSKTVIRLGLSVSIVTNVATSIHINSFDMFPKSTELHQQRVAGL